MSKLMNVKKRQYVALPFCVVALCLMTTMMITSAYAKDEPKGFYTIVDGQGRLIVIRTDEKSTPVEKTDGKKVAKSTAQQSEVKSDEAPAQSRAEDQVVQLNTQTTDVDAAQLQPVLNPAIDLSSQQRDYEIKPSQERPLIKTERAYVPPVQSNKVVPQQQVDITQQNNHPAQYQQNVAANDGSTQSNTDNELPVIKESVAIATPIAKPQQLSRQVQTNGNKAQANQKETQTKNELLRFQDDKYIDSQALIEKSFNPTDEKRFYALPNGNGSVDFIERKSGVNLKNLIPKRSPNLLFSTSSNYQRIPRDALSELLPSMCVKPDALKKLSYLSDREPVNLWPRKGKPDEFSANLVKLDRVTREISMVSYAQRANNPTYYWPLAIFLDRKGCAIEAAGQFFQRDIAATWLQQSGLKGNLLVPENASYLMLTPLAQSPDLPNKTLAKNGQLKLTVFGTLP